PTAPLPPRRGAPPRAPARRAPRGIDAGARGTNAFHGAAVEERLRDVSSEIQEPHWSDDLAVRIEERRLTRRGRKVKPECRTIHRVPSCGGGAGEGRQEIGASLEHAGLGLFHALRGALHTVALARRQLDGI